MIELKCHVCGKRYYVKPYRKHKSKTCSKSCGSKFSYHKTLGKIDHKHLIGNQFRKGKSSTNAFRKGHIPWNKDKKGIHLSPQSEWKKGMKGRNWMPVGTITQRKTKRGVVRNFIKIREPNISVPFATYVWEKNYGKLKKSDVVHHRDGDKLNDKKTNLIALPRTDHPIFDSKWGLKQLTQRQLRFYRNRYLLKKEGGECQIGNGFLNSRVS